MRTRAAPPISWYWLAGFLLMHDAQQLVDFDLTEYQLAQRFLGEIRRLPAASQRAVSSLTFTEHAITAATGQQHAILTIAFRRLLAAFTREERQRRVAPKGGEPL